MDTSSFQGNVDWTSAARNGSTFAYVKATEGTYYADSAFFPQQYNGSYAAGMIRGAYHFAIPNNSIGAAQADYFVSRGGGWSRDGHTLPGMLDIEFNPYGAECYGLSQQQMVNWIASFDAEYQRLTSREPVLYTNAIWWNDCTGGATTFSQANPLFVANYGGSPYPLPGGWGYYSIWQYSDNGTFPGDQDTFNGDYARLQALATGGAPPAVTPYTPPPPPPPPVSDRVPTGGLLTSGKYILSSRGGYSVSMQGDGNLVEYAPGGHPLWASGTAGRPGSYMAMQRDGNMVVYTSAHVPVFATGTSGRGPSFAVIQYDANFVLYTDNGSGPTWASRGGRIR